jgi:V/A-type H+/Na+-transporting ATPase subunit B
VSSLQRTYRGAASAAGPLLVLERTRRASLGEWVRIVTPGLPERRGQVIDAGEHTTLVHVLEETIGLAPSRSDVVLTGNVATTVVGRDLLGRAMSGVGAPLDGLPVPIGEAVRPIGGSALNPARRARPRDFIETGISAIDGMNTLVRGQKLPIFSGAGLPGLELAAQIVRSSRAPKGEQFAVIFVAIGITARETEQFLAGAAEQGWLARTVLYLNQASDPPVERLLAPRIALTEAEFLAFECGTHVLVVMADLTHYCEALREIATAREEIPGRRGYPGYMYTDLASLFERAGVVQGIDGSITQIPIVTLPDDDITHPIPDLTGYITEGQVVLSRELHRKGIYPPIDVIPSLSRLMSAGIGTDRTRADHRELTDQLYAMYAKGRDAMTMAAVVGVTGLTDADRRAAEFTSAFEREFVSQREHRTISETLEIGWRLLHGFPRDELLRISDATFAARHEAHV